MPWMETLDHIGGAERQKEGKWKALRLLLWAVVLMIICTHTK